MDLCNEFNIFSLFFIYYGNELRVKVENESKSSDFKQYVCVSGLR